MNNEERFIKRCSRVDFDARGGTQARVWARVTAPRALVWRRWAALGACAVFLFAAGFGFSRWVSGPVRTVPVPNQNCAPAAEPYFLLCVKDGARSTGYCCKKHALYGEPAGFYPARKECSQDARPELPSFYNFRQNC